VIADGVEAVAVDSLPVRLARRGGAQLLVEDAVAEPLTGFDLAGAGRLTQDQIAAPGGNVSRLWQRALLLARVFATVIWSWKVTRPEGGVLTRLPGRLRASGGS
jgi:hypothetical protein